MITPEKLSNMIADAQSKIGKYHALILSKQDMIEALELLQRYMSIIDMGPDVEPNFGDRYVDILKNADAEKYLGG